MVKRIILNVENELTVLDTIYKKYITLPSNLIFIKNNRYPITDKQKFELDKLFRVNMASYEPFHPFLCIPTVIDILTLLIYSGHSYLDLYLYNSLLKEKGYESKKFIQTFNTDVEDIILEHLPNISKSDFNTVLKTINKIYTNINQYILEYDNYIFEFETDTGYLVLVNKGDIRAFRFDEYREFLKYN